MSEKKNSISFEEFKDMNKPVQGNSKYSPADNSNFNYTKNKPGRYQYLSNVKKDGKKDNRNNDMRLINYYPKDTFEVINSKINRHGYKWRQNRFVRRYGFR